MDRAFSISLLVGASIGGSFAAAMRKSDDSIAGLTASVKSLNATAGKAGRFIKLQNEAKQAANSLADKERRLESLKRELTATQNPTQKLRREFNAARRSVDKARNALRNKRTTMATMRAELKKSGVDVRNIRDEFSRLGRELDQVRRKQKDYIKLERQRRALRADRQSKIGGLVSSGAALIGVAAFPVREAIEFEEAMTDVAKNVKGLDTEEDVNKFGKEIRKLSFGSRLSAAEIANLASEAGKLGEGREGAIKFAEASEKMAVAMDLSTDEAGRTIGKLRTTLNLSTDDVLELADSINFVGDNSASNAANITEIIRDVGALGVNAGFTKEQTVGLAAAIDGVSKSPEVAATAMKKLLTSLSKGEAASGPAKEALNDLGFSAVEMAEAMQEDAPAAIQEFIKAFDDIPESERIAALTSIVGEEGLGPIQNLIAAQDSLSDAFAKSTDKAASAGSITDEYNRKNRTSAALIARTRNKLAAAGDAIGRILLPPLNTLLGVVGTVAIGFANFAEEFPTLTSAVVGLGVGLVALKFATTGASIAGSYLKEGWLIAGKTIGFIGSSVIPKVTAGLRILTAAAVANPIGAIVTGLAIGATLVIANWETVKGWFVDLFDWIKEIAPVVLGALSPILDPVGTFLSAGGAVADFVFGGDSSNTPALAGATGGSFPADVSDVRAVTANVAGNSNRTEINQRVQMNVTAAPGREGIAAQEINRALARQANAGQYDELD